MVKYNCLPRHVSSLGLKIADEADLVWQTAANWTNISVQVGGFTDLSHNTPFHHFSILCILQSTFGSDWFMYIAKYFQFSPAKLHRCPNTFLNLLDGMVLLRWNEVNPWDKWETFQPSPLPLQNHPIPITELQCTDYVPHAHIQRTSSKPYYCSLTHERMCFILKICKGPSSNYPNCAPLPYNNKDLQWDPQRHGWLSTSCIYVLGTFYALGTFYVLGTFSEQWHS